MKRPITIFALLLALMALAVLPAAAQNDAPGANYPANTITVTGSGSANGSPDIASMTVGVEVFNTDLSAAFSEVNGRIDTIISTMVALGVAREDIQTTSLNVYLDRFGGQPPMPDPAGQNAQQPAPSYGVSNQIRIVVRDIDMIADVVNAAVENGATNVFGPEFGIDDRDSLESEARSEAMTDARERAQALADLAGVELGDIIVIQEGSAPTFGPFNQVRMSDMGMGGGGAIVEPGQLSVTTTITVTFAIAG